MRQNLAGAEASYGMPSGGEFALELFRRKFESANAAFVRQCKAISPDSRYARVWLPHDFRNKNVYAFGKPKKRKVFQDTLASRRVAISSMLFYFGSLVVSVVHRLGAEGVSVSRHYKALTEEQFLKNSYTNDVRSPCGRHEAVLRKIFCCGRTAEQRG